MLLSSLLRSVYCEPKLIQVHAMSNAILLLWCMVALAVQIGRIFAAHGGISPEIETLDDINAIDRCVRPKPRSVAAVLTSLLSAEREVSG